MLFVVNLTKKVKIPFFQFCHSWTQFLFNTTYLVNNIQISCILSHSGQISSKSPRIFSLRGAQVLDHPVGRGEDWSVPLLRLFISTSFWAEKWKFLLCLLFFYEKILRPLFSRKNSSPPVDGPDPVPHKFYPVPYRNSSNLVRGRKIIILAIRTI